MNNFWKMLRHIIFLYASICDLEFTVLLPLFSKRMEQMLTSVPYKRVLINIFTYNYGY
jgi:hypothetical protein